MKKQIILTAIALIASFGMANAQMGPVSAGLEFALPMGDWADANSMGIGLSAGYEHPVGDNIGVTAQLGYIMLFVDESVKDFIQSQSMMPIQAGVKYYISEQQNGVYVHGQIGVHSMSVKTKEFELFGVTVPSETTSSTNLSFAFGGGFMVNEKIDLGLRYNIITPDSDVEGAESSSYLGVRIAYSLFGGE